MSFPDLPPIVGYARTTTIRSVAASGLPAAEQQARRLAYYEYVGTGHGPRINVIQDIDGADAGFGAFWGEVQSAVHKALGCLGVITDGSIRDIDQWAPGFQALAGSIGPSHAFVHAESFGGEVRVAGMTVRSGDLIHADRHGAVVIPLDVAAKLPEAAELCGRRETPILEIARSPSFHAGKTARGAGPVSGNSLTTSERIAMKMTGKTVLITGSTDGVGRYVAAKLAAAGANVLIHGRDQARAKTLADEIRREGHGKALSTRRICRRSPARESSPKR